MGFGAILICFIVAIGLFPTMPWYRYDDEHEGAPWGWPGYVVAVTILAVMMSSLSWLGQL